MKGLHLIVAAVMALFALGALLWPLGAVVSTSLSPSGAELEFSAYLEVVTSSYYREALVVTTVFCLATAFLGTLWALPLAWRLGRNAPGARVLRGLCQLNFAFAGIIYGMLIIVLMGNAGALVIVERALFGTETTRGLAYTTFGLAITYLSFQIPRAALLISEAVAKLDPQLPDAARVLGARGTAVALHVVLPLLRPVIAEATLLSFLLAMGSFGPALLIARTITIFPEQIYREFTGYTNFAVAGAMSLILLAVALAIGAGLRCLARAPLSPRRSEPRKALS